MFLKIIKVQTIREEAGKIAVPLLISIAVTSASRTKTVAIILLIALSQMCTGWQTF